MTQNIVKYYKEMFFRLSSISMGTFQSLPEEFKGIGGKVIIIQKWKWSPPLHCFILSVIPISYEEYFVLHFVCSLQRAA